MLPMEQRIALIDPLERHIKGAWQLFEREAGLLEQRVHERYVDVLGQVSAAKLALQAHSACLTW
jgi:hypothetical protein